MSADFSIHPAYAAAIRWSRRGSCGNAGCKDPECCCAFCREPIGVPDDDPRWDNRQRVAQTRRTRARRAGQLWLTPELEYAHVPAALWPRRALNSLQPRLF